MVEDDYERLLAAQGGRCAICGGTEAKHGESTRLHIDHNHETGEVRGLLCNNCNRALGYFHDQWELLDIARLYLTRNRPAAEAHSKRMAKR